MKEFWERARRKDEFLDACRRKWKEQGKTGEECRRMWPQALADRRAEREAKEWNFPEFDTMLRKKLGLIEDTPE